MTFPTDLDDFTNVVDDVDDVMAIDINELQDAIEALEAKVGIDNSVVTGSLDYKVNNFFASGRKLYLYENTAPTGWSILGVTDKVLAVKGGSQAYNVNGGNQAGSWAQPSHILSIPEMPSHYHYQGSFSYPITYTVGDTTYRDVSDAYWAPAQLTQGSGVKQFQTHLQGSGSAHSHGTTYRPYAAVGIIIEKT